MAGLNSFFSKIGARIGVVADLLNTILITGEIAFTTDDQTGYFGNSTTTPARVPTDKSTGTFDFSGSKKWTTPGGIVFDSALPGQVNGVNITTLNQQDGLLVRKGDNIFGSTTVVSSDQSVIVENGNGKLGNIDLALNLNDNLITYVLQKTLTISSTPPANPKLGMQWFDPDDETLYERVGDGTTAVWLDISSQ